MNFFKHQDDARKNTFRLLILFGLAVLALIILTNLLIAGVFWGVAEYSTNSYQATSNPSHTLAAYLTWERFLTVALWVAGTICLVILFKWSQLRSGGRAVAERMGGVLISSGSNDFAERQLLNVVEEMAIASGLPVPPVYLLEEPGINAFAAGFQPGDAVIGVTRGALQVLNREQLQGVIAHEFSHILHGDMSLNMKLIAVLAGILFVGQAGYIVLRSSRHSRGKNSAPLALLGFGLLALGYLGVFFGNLIKAGVSRQREYLADASAVQYTRHPAGIADALKIIGGNTPGSRLDTRKAEENSHMFFSNALMRKASSPFATHPPLENRIRRIEPDWDGQYLAPHSPITSTAINEPSQIGSKLNSATAPIASLAEQVDNAHLLHHSALKYSHNLLANLPEPLRAASQDSFYARALMFALLLNTKDTKIREQQLVLLERCNDLRQRTEQLLPFIKGLQSGQRLPLVELAIPALKQQSTQQYETFKSLMDEFIDSDQTVALFEWMLQRLLRYYLDSEFETPGKWKIQTSLRPLDIQCFEVLSLLAYRGHGNFHDAEHAYLRAIFVLELGPANLIGEYTLSNEKIDRALTQLKRLKPALKHKFLKACAVCIEADKQITVTEAELFRVISALLNCPMPPLLLRGT